MSVQMGPQVTSVYRYYDSYGLLIYVGITKQGMGRNLQHNGRAEWWPFVTRQEVEHLPSRQAAMAREKALIRQFRPPFNRQHNMEHEALRTAYLAFAGEPLPDERPVDVFTRMKRRLPFDFLCREKQQMVFRSRLAHAPLAVLLQIEKLRVPVLHMDNGGHRIGHVGALQVDSSFAYLKIDESRWMPSDATMAEALLLWRTKPKPGSAVIQRVFVDGTKAFREGIRDGRRGRARDGD